MTINDMYDFLLDYVTDNRDALDLAFSLNGMNEETAVSILYYYTGYRDFDQYREDMEL